MDPSESTGFDPAILLLALLILGIVVGSNIWLRLRAEGRSLPELWAQWRSPSRRPGPPSDDG